jgi:hypothetical protein
LEETGGIELKAKIYSRTGEVSREVKCKGISPFCGDMVQLEGSGVYTNMSVVFEGPHPKASDHFAGPKFDVTHVASKRTWRGASVLIFFKDIYQFSHNGKWFTVTGEVIIDAPNGV